MPCDPRHAIGRNALEQHDLTPRNWSYVPCVALVLEYMVNSSRHTGEDVYHV